MVIGPAGVGKTSLIRRLTGQVFNPAEKTTKGTEQNIVSKSAVSSWKTVGNEKDARDEVAESLASCKRQAIDQGSKGAEEQQQVARSTGFGELPSGECQRIGIGKWMTQASCCFIDDITPSKMNFPDP
ncbi:uncharacterized protein LOC121417649 [Lytechinus variegatus]|uniref:uncharacterized protein LOC121417649 n=1 Tax=Lytechinus variegatus TaxID=7654 RepID=UPI001BB135CC|nr:uncharacterized protein LOC121417649 [Lytechinus variegatus]